VAINLDGESDTALLPFAWIDDARLVIDEALMKRGSEARAQRLANDIQPPPSQDPSS
jgi:ribosome maturation factor RimP